MKRREEITKSAKNKYPYIKGLPQSASHQAIFIEAAEWADKTLIDKACQWIKVNMPNYINFEEGFIYEVDMADDLRKAMEE